MNSNDKYHETIEQAKELVELQEERISELEKQAMERVKIINPTKIEPFFKKLTNIPTQTVAEQRKAIPIFSGVLMYFPDAIREVAKCSQAGNNQHHKDKPLHWDRSKSGDELDALARHLMDAGTFDTDGVRHSAKVAWRALANLQKEIEKDNE
tara:strand:+ start:2078 stop:2536 length:459 start_codon:yes stop_codon:yes gene_type:complete